MWTFLFIGCWVSEKNASNDNEETDIIDMDFDGTPANIDCDDNNPSSTIVAEDSDCDGTLTADDCDDADPNSTIVAEDSDCDGIFTEDDCDDSDAGLLSISEDQDCDGTLASGDCNDADPNSTVVAQDGDCDGTLTAEDCDDFDENSTVVIEDNDCDGVLTVEDCDDSDVSLGSIIQDGDCDGVLTADDCDDLDGNSTVLAEDGDCDGVLTAEDCDDANANVLAIIDDGDCDGAFTADDCDDADPSSTIVADDGDCDGVIGIEDCDDTDPNQVTNIADDGDCDGTPAVEDCDDTDPNQNAACTFHNGIPFVTVPSGSSHNGVYSITRPFLLTEVEVTQDAYFALLGTNPSSDLSCGGSCPVEQVSWDQAAYSANLLTIQVNATEGTAYNLCYDCDLSNPAAPDCAISGAFGTLSDCTGFRLPTEAEWEYAARAGTSADFWTGPNTTGGTTTSTSCSSTVLLNDPNYTNFSDLAWYCGNSTSTLQVSNKRANGFDLRGMYGNVSEWVHDGSGIFPSGSVDPVTGESFTRMIRGGAFNSQAPDCASGVRHSEQPTYTAPNLGYRLARTIH